MADAALLLECNPAKFSCQVIGNKILWQMKKAGDGLSLEHLSGLLEKYQKLEIQMALAYLESKGEIVKADNDWWYPLNLPDEPITTTRHTPSMSNTTMSTGEKLRLWFKNRDPNDAPKTLLELADLLNTNTNKLGKVLSATLKELPEDQALLLNAAINRRPATRKDLAKPEAPVVVADEIDWVAEFRARLMGKQIPESAKLWQETLGKMDEIFSELGIAENHRSRAHLREICQWLTV